MDVEEEDFWCDLEKFETEMDVKEEVVEEEVVVEEDEEDEEDFWCDLEKFETEMDVLYFIKERLSHHPAPKPLFPSYISENLDYAMSEMKRHLETIEEFITTTTFTDEHVDGRSQIMGHLLLAAHELFSCDSGKHFTKNYWDYILRRIQSNIWNTVNAISLLKGNSKRKMEWVASVIDAYTNTFHDVKNLEMFLVETKDFTRNIESMNLYSEEKKVNLLAHQLLHIKAFPTFVGLKESSDMVNFISEVYDQMETLISGICWTCEGHAQLLMLIGGLLSFRRLDIKTWDRVLKDLQECISRNDIDQNIDVRYWYEDPSRGIKLTRCIFSYCIDDLHYSLRACLPYVACYPIGSEIPAASVTKMWVAEGFITPEKGETEEETANKYLEELAQRSLIWISMRSLSSTIKYFRVARIIRYYLLNIENRTKFDHVINPHEENMKSLNRVAIHNIGRQKYRKAKSYSMRSFLAFDIPRNVLRTATYLRVLELRNSVVEEIVLEKMPHLQYLGLRGSTISDLSKIIGNMKTLQTLDVRDTKIETLPESLWTITTLRHVYVNPGPRIEGPPPTANIPNLQTLKTVVVPKSWIENDPQLSINLRKLALSFEDHLELQTISNALSRTVKLLSIAITGPVIPAEVIDTRGLPNLETLKSIKLVGVWKFRKLSIDNVGFPSNLAKLILSNSRLKEDPMPRLERLQALKWLSIEDRAYTGKEMVCSTNGFPQLQFLQLSELDNLEIWEVEAMAMPQLTTLRVVQCQKLKKLPDLEHVEDKIIDN